ATATEDEAPASPSPGPGDPRSQLEAPKSQSPGHSPSPTPCPSAPVPRPGLKPPTRPSLLMQAAALTTRVGLPPRWPKMAQDGRAVQCCAQLRSSTQVMDP
ncbi:hypothetical protein E4U43_002245, partial [Claviceps pusilla]